MKKSLLLFAAILISGIYSAQVADGTYESGYQSGYFSILREYPKVTPLSPQWQNLDLGNANAPNLSNDKNDYQRNIQLSWNKGYAQGIMDAKHTSQSSKKESSSKAKAKKM